MLWFGITVVDEFERQSQEMHGPYEDIDGLTDAVDAVTEEIEDSGGTVVPIVFELCTDDVPEIVSMG